MSRSYGKTKSPKDSLHGMFVVGSRQTSVVYFWWFCKLPWNFYAYFKLIFISVLYFSIGAALNKLQWIGRKCLSNPGSLPPLTLSLKKLARA